METTSLFPQLDEFAEWKTSAYFIVETFWDPHRGTLLTVYVSLCGVTAMFTVGITAMQWMKVLWRIDCNVKKTRYVDGTPTSQVTPVTIRYICSPHHGHS